MAYLTVDAINRLIHASKVRESANMKQRAAAEADYNRHMRYEQRLQAKLANDLNMAHHWASCRAEAEKRNPQPETQPKTRRCDLSKSDLKALRKAELDAVPRSEP